MLVIPLPIQKSPKIYLKFDLKCFHSIVFRFYYCVIIKQMNSNKNYITTFCISCNTYSYSYSCVITITIYQMCPNCSAWSRILVKIPQMATNKSNHAIQKNKMRLIPFHATTQKNQQNETQEAQFKTRLSGFGNLSKCYKLVQR